MVIFLAMGIGAGFYFASSSLFDKPSKRQRIDSGSYTPTEALLVAKDKTTVMIMGVDERKDDIPALINYFSEACFDKGMTRKTFSDEAVKMLQAKSWPGNVRELNNVVERLLILGGSTISAQDVKDFVNL